MTTTIRYPEPSINSTKMSLHLVLSKDLVPYEQAVFPWLEWLLLDLLSSNSPFEGSRLRILGALDLPHLLRQ